MVTQRGIPGRRAARDYDDVRTKFRLRNSQFFFPLLRASGWTCQLDAQNVNAAAVVIVVAVADSSIHSSLCRQTSPRHHAFTPTPKNKYSPTHTRAHCCRWPREKWSTDPFRGPRNEYTRALWPFSCPLLSPPFQQSRARKTIFFYATTVVFGHIITVVLSQRMFVISCGRIPSFRPLGSSQKRDALTRRVSRPCSYTNARRPYYTYTWHGSGTQKIIGSGYVMMIYIVDHLTQ